MSSVIEAAREAARKAIEGLYYEGTCSIVEFQDITDETTNITDQQEVTVYEGIPCKLSFEKADTATQTDTAATVTQGTKLFIAPEIKVNADSKIIIDWLGETHEYSMSGEAAVYTSHQEIMLEIFRGWA